MLNDFNRICYSRWRTKSFWWKAMFLLVSRSVPLSNFLICLLLELIGSSMLDWQSLHEQQPLKYEALLEVCWFPELTSLFIFSAWDRQTYRVLLSVVHLSLLFIGQRCQRHQKPSQGNKTLWTYVFEGQHANRGKRKSWVNLIPSGMKSKSK